MKVIFLYTELAEYFLVCINAFINKYNAEVHIIRWDVNKEAPFSFSFSGNIKVYERNQLSEKSILDLVEKISPDVVFCSGWIDNAYLKVCKRFRHKIPVIVGFDNKWTGSIKQRGAAMFSKMLIHSNFSHCWIPGNSQMEFAHRLGFSDKYILSGLYSCDYNLFNALHLKFIGSKRSNYPHRLIYVGRYYKCKGITDLWKSFIEIQNENPNDWELWCLGTGNVAPRIHPKIKHVGFVQPKNMERFILETGVFILPSHFEPWGVAVHEFSSAGFPLICSDEVGAAKMFLNDRNNGFIFPSGNIDELKTAVRKIMMMSDEKLLEMGEKSAELAKQITPDKWADTLMSVVR